jgi:hypothetical protein
MHKSGISGVYEEFRADIAKHAGKPHDDDFVTRQNDRAIRVKKIMDADGLKDAEDHFEAALVLVEVDDIDVLKVSETLALKAADMGESRGFRVAAEAQDKQLVRMGMAQRYGTQYIYEPVLRGWRLYPYDARTTDEERKAMGVPPLAELIKGEDKLNQNLKENKPKF